MIKRLSILVLILLIGCSADGFSIPQVFNNSGFPPLPPMPPMPDWGNQSGGVWDGFKSLVNAHTGQSNCTSLPQLKQYLEQFGYAPTPTTAEDSISGTEFDNRTEAAVKLYQQNFNLSVTGVLDEATLRQMIRPRCGREDVVNGVSVMGGGNSSSSSRIHAVQHYSFFPNSPKWDSKQSLTYAVASDAASLSGISNSNLNSVFDAAFGEWAAVVPIKFNRVDDFSSADIRIVFASGEHGDGKPFDGVLGVLAHAFSPEDGRLHFDAAESWTLNGASASAGRTAVDLRSVAVHEIGHILGLGHSADEAAIMYPNIGAREVKLRLSTDDVAGAQQLYGANPDYDPNQQSEARSQTETSAAADGTVPRLLLLLPAVLGILGVLW